MKKIIFLIAIFMQALASASAQFILDYLPPAGSNCYFNCIIPYGNNYLAGGTIEGGTPNNKILLVEITASGYVVRDRTITVSNNSLRPVVTSMLFDSDGQLVIAGERDAGNLNTETPFIIRLTYPACAFTFQTIYNNVGAYFMKVLETKAGGSFYACGQNASVSNQDALLVSVDRITGAISHLDYRNLGTAETYYSLVKVGISNYYASSRFNFDQCCSNRMREGVSPNSAAVDLRSLIAGTSLAPRRMPASIQ